MKQFTLKKLLKYLVENRKKIFKIILFAISAIVVISLMPGYYRFSYDFNKGQQWKYEDLYAPFDFPVLKQPEEINREREKIINEARNYYTYSDSVVTAVIKEYETDFDIAFQNTQGRKVNQLKVWGKALLDSLYKPGIIVAAGADSQKLKDDFISVMHGNKEEVYLLSELKTGSEAIDFAMAKTIQVPDSDDAQKMKTVFSSVIEPNVFFDARLTEVVMKDRLSKIPINTGLVPQGKLIVANGEIISENTYNIISSLQQEYNRIDSDQLSSWGSKVGMGLIVIILFVLLYVFINTHQGGVYYRSREIIFILFNILLIFILCKICSDVSLDLIYIVPVFVLPLILRSFFNYRVALVASIITVLLVSVFSPDTSMYLYYGVITALGSVVVNKYIYHRAKLFVSVGKITLIGLLVCASVLYLQDSRITAEGGKILVFVCLGGLLTLFALPLIYIYEKMFGLVSDISLLELTDTNAPLMREMAKKAPGTFQHVLQVANIAEDAARELGADPLLTRVGALYHDVGKLANPEYFTENLNPAYSPHNDLPPEESAKIIINHIAQGIEIARKHRLPGVVIDFIRSHHGGSYVYGFYMKAVGKYGEENVSIDDYRYPYRKPITKEEAIVMICDSVEAASRSLKEYTEKSIGELVDSVIGRQTKDGQFDEAEISFRQISQLKSILKQYLKNMYHTRIEYKFKQQPI